MSGPSLGRALERLRDVRELGITMPGTVSIPPSRIAVLARFADKAKVSVVERLPEARRWATLVAFIHTLEASAQDDALEVFEMLIGEVFGEALAEDRKARLRSLKDLDALAIKLSEAMTVVVDLSIPDTGLREALFNRFPRDSLVQTLTEIGTLVRPPDDVFYQSLDQQHGRVRGFLPALLTHIHFAAGQADTHLLAALDYLRRRKDSELELPVPLDVVPPKWRRHVGDGQSRAEQRAYTFCVLDRLRKALHRRDVFVAPSWRYADPRSGLLEGAQWQATRPMICRTLARRRVQSRRLRRCATSSSRPIGRSSNTCRRTRPCGLSELAIATSSFSRTWTSWTNPPPSSLCGARSAPGCRLSIYRRSS